MRQLPTTWGMELANWNWKVAGQFVWERYGISISRSGCLKWLHRLGFAYKRPKKRLLKADEGKRTDFVAEYATQSTPLCGRSARRREPGCSSLTRPTSERTRSCGANGH